MLGGVLEFHTRDSPQQAISGKSKGGSVGGLNLIKAFRREIGSSPGPRQAVGIAGTGIVLTKIEGGLALPSESIVVTEWNGC